MKLQQPLQIIVNGAKSCEDIREMRMLKVIVAFSWRTPFLCM